MALAEDHVSEDEEESKDGVAEENKSEDNNKRQKVRVNPEKVDEVEMQEEVAHSLVVSSATFVP